MPLPRLIMLLCCVLACAALTVWAVTASGLALPLIGFVALLAALLLHVATRAR